MKNLADKLIEIIEKKHTPACVGLDPQPELIPQKILESAHKRFGKGLRGTAEAFYQFNLRVIDIISPHIGIVKPQIAFYEALGQWGIKAYINTTKYAHKKGLIVIGDIKRGDVSHTAEAYARAHLGGVYEADAVTVNPYLGSDSLAPFINMAEEFNKGVFVLVKTTNPSSTDFQNLTISKPSHLVGVKSTFRGRAFNDSFKGGGDNKLYEHVAEKVNLWGKPLIGKSGYSSIGAVVGATAGQRTIAQLRNLMPNAPFLVPGYGAQGATAKDVKHCFNPDGYGAIISASRSITYAWQHSPWKEKYGQKKWEKAVEAAVIEMKNELNE